MPLDEDLFEALSLTVSKQIVSTVSTVIEATKASTVVPASNQRSFMTALLIQQADLLHELIGFMLVDGTPPSSKGSKELRLLAALLVHYSSADVHKPFTAALSMVRRMGHEIPETLIVEK